MNNRLCDELQLYQPTETEAKDLYSSYIVNIILNIFFSITAIFLNSVTIEALRRISSSSSFSKPLKTLLLSLAISDLGVGLLWTPFYIAFLVKWSLQNKDNNPTCDAYTAHVLILRLFCSASFLGVMALSVDRFLAIHLHLRYQELVTHMRVVAAEFLIWVSSAFTSLLRLWLPIITSSAIFLIIPQIVCLALAAVLYCKIYLAVRRHRNQIHALQVQVAQNSEMANAARLRKSALGSFYVYLVFLACYLPQICSSVSMIYKPSSAAKGFFLYSMTLVFLNSSLNPVIYCWKIRHIRHAIMNILRNIFPSHN